MYWCFWSSEFSKMSFPPVIHTYTLQVLPTDYIMYVSLAGGVIHVLNLGVMLQNIFRKLQLPSSDNAREGKIIENQGPLRKNFHKEIFRL